MLGTTPGTTVRIPLHTVSVSRASSRCEREHKVTNVPLGRIGVAERMLRARAAVWQEYLRRRLLAVAALVVGYQRPSVQDVFQVRRWRRAYCAR